LKSEFNGKPKGYFKRLMSMQKWIKIFVVGVIVLIASCKKNKNFSPTPYLEYKSHVLVSQDQDPANFPFDYADVTLYFTDGDGNLGQDADFQGIACCDTCNFYCNLFVEVWSKVDGVWDNKYEYNARIDDMTPTSQDKTLEGDILYKVSLSGRFSDTVRIDFKIFDRDLQSSALISTPEIYVDL
jgi:hypothetical protein